MIHKRLAQFSLVFSGIFVFVILLGFIGVPLVWIPGVLENLFGFPLYILIFVSFVVTGVAWFKDRNKENFKYFAFSCISGVLVVSTLVILIWHYAQAMENF